MICFLGEPYNKRPNLFTEVLSPLTTGGKLSEEAAGDGGSFQAEIHYRQSCNNSSKFTIMVNNMRVMCIFDWWLTLQEFLTAKPQTLDAEQQGKRKKLTSLNRYDNRAQKIHGTLS